MKGCAELPIAPRLARGTNGTGGGGAGPRSTPAQLSLTPSITCLHCGFWGILRPPFPLGNPRKLSFYS